MKEKKILIIEDHPIVRKGFSMLINQDDELKTIGEAGDYHSALDMVRKTKADLILLDLSLGDGNGIELIKEVKVINPALPVLVVSLHDENLYAERALKAGARGYIMKSEATDNILTAIKKIINGEVYLSDGMKDKLINRVAGTDREGSSPMDILSDREFEVFQFIGDGRTTKEIAEILNLSVKTVETYKSHIKSKLEIKDSTDLIRRAVEWKVADS